ncbi:hypothetical protein BT67DRAFT_357609, partial [Trichocladium antarcticum]
QRCPICQSTLGLRRCGGCKVASYCGPAHQSAHRSTHMAACEAIKWTRATLEREEAALRTHPGGSFPPGDLFKTGPGRFWGIFETRDYMRARFAAADALVKAHTAVGVETGLEHLMDMMRLCRSDNMGLRNIIPGLMLRLGREQECYDFLKWWATVDGDYDWGNMELPYLNIRGADVFEPLGMCRPSALSLSQLVMLTLLKLRLRLDLEACESELTEPDRPVGKLVRSRAPAFDMHRMSATIEAVTDQYHTLCQAVFDANPYFWAELDEVEDLPALPSFYTLRSVEEAHLAVIYCKRAWLESEDALVMIEADTSKFISKCECQTTIAGTGAARPSTPQQRAENLERRRGVGDVFPSKFKPPLPTSSPLEVFPPSLDPGQSARFVSGNDARTTLVYVDGACANNGQPNPRAGWAVVYGPGNAVSGRLEDKGPFGHDSVATSNRAELRAAIAALRLCDWGDEDIDRLVVATDSSYVVAGATGWTKGWVRNGWKTRTGGDVKNQDLWELLLGEVERWQERGLRVALWKIPRGLNVDADTGAKEAAANGTAEVEFRDVVVTSP